jgi:hypothetical protein
MPSVAAMVGEGVEIIPCVSVLLGGGGRIASAVLKRDLFDHDACISGLGLGLALWGDWWWACCTTWELAVLPSVDAKKSAKEDFQLG